MSIPVLQSRLTNAMRAVFAAIVDFWRPSATSPSASMSAIGSATNPQAAHFQPTVQLTSIAASPGASLPYPPVDPGIPSQPVEEMLRGQKSLIDRIKLCYGADYPTFEADLLPLIRRYAEFVHLLPATPDNYFNAPGGLLRLGLEVGFFSLQGTDGHIFSGRSTITVRRQLEPRWRHATFIAGLCCELYRTLSRLIVTDEQGNQWQPYLDPLAHWLEKQNAGRYFLKWRTNCHESRCVGLFVLPHIVSPSVLQHLATDNDVIVPHLMASLSGMALYREHNIVESLVRRSLALVVDRYLQASGDRYGTPVLGSHLERYLVDALRRLMNSAACWVTNSEKAWVWLGTDGMYLLWPGAATAAVNLLEADRLPGIPKSTETILEILVAAGVLEPQSPTQSTWQIVPPEYTMPLEAVKLSFPAILLSDVDPEPQPLAIKLVRPVPAQPPNGNPASTNTPHSATKPDKNQVDKRQMTLPIEQEASPPDATTAQSNAPVERTTDPPTTPVQVPITAANKQLTLALPAFKLDAPMRLNSVVRDGLAQIIDTMNQGGKAAACTVSTGVFVPLTEFASRKIEVPFVLSSLTEAKMLVLCDTEPTITRDFAGAAQLGLVIHPSFVAGLDASDFDLPE